MLTLNSPAKINLFLRVKARRADGYHELATLMQTVGLCDTITMELAEHDSLSCTNPQIPTDTSNLIWKAIHAFRKHTGMNCFVDVGVDKKIPIQAGLGGGSSNAATALKGMNTLCGSPLSVEELMMLGAQVGSDVPFFLF